MIGPRCQEGYISFYLNKEFYELNLSAFNSIFSFHHVWIYDTVMSLRNSTRILVDMKFSMIIGMTPTIPRVQLFEIPVFVWPNACLLVVCFGREDTLNVPHLSKLYFLFSMLEGDQIGPRSFFVNQLCRTITSSTQRIISGEPYYPLLLG